jgi:LysM repeat protein
METLTGVFNMNRKIMLSLLFVLPLAGCETIQAGSTRESAARQQAALRVTEERLHRLQARVESIESDNARLTREVEQLRADNRALNKQVATLQGSIQTLEARQQKQNQQLIAQVEKLLKKSVSRAPAAQAPRGPGREHIVEAGHTLSAIAKAYGTTVKAIKEANHLKSDNIYVGQKLFIPE